jgi:hypothetical protein
MLNPTGIAVPDVRPSPPDRMDVASFYLMRAIVNLRA